MTDSPISNQVRDAVEWLANTAMVTDMDAMSGWDRHSNVLLCAADEIERLQQRVAELERESGFMVGAYARLKELQEAERERDDLREKLADTPQSSKERVSEDGLRNLRVWACAGQFGHTCKEIIGAIDELLELRSAHTPAVEQSREAFERFFQTSRGKKAKFELLKDGSYADNHVQRHWWTWQQACTSRSSPPPAAHLPPFSVRWAIGQLLDELPQGRDWLNPDVEKILREYIRLPETKEESHSGRQWPGEKSACSPADDRGIATARSSEIGIGREDVPAESIQSREPVDSNSVPVGRASPEQIHAKDVDPAPSITPEAPACSTLCHPEESCAITADGKCGAVETEECDHLYFAVAGTPIGSGQCFKCGAQEPPESEEGRHG